MRIAVLVCAFSLLPTVAIAHELTAQLGKVGSGNLKMSPASEVPEVAKSFAAFDEHLGISWDEDFVYIEGNGLPEHGMMKGITAWQQQVPLPHDYTGTKGAFRIPIRPELLDEPEELTLRGPIALAVNGIPIFHSLTQSGKDAKADGELDEWGGHCGRADDYHYHVAPGHLEAVVGKGNPVAYGLDGFPVYMADPAKDKPLDAAHGYFDDEGNYRYVSGDEAPYMMGMFHGKVNLEVRPSTQGVRPFLRPLRGAVITDFTGTLETGYTLHYQVNGKLGIVAYQLRENAVDFVFNEPDGSTSEESYQRLSERNGDGDSKRGAKLNKSKKVQ